jgi:amino acid adenylation domain-containing protein
MTTFAVDCSFVPDDVRAVSRSHPHSIALIHDDRQLSYEELDRRADRFAAYLAQLGVRTGDAVAICLERSFDWITAALGIMRANAAYVPLDAAWPESRLRFAVADSGATVFVARKPLIEKLHLSVRGIDPAHDAAAIAASPELARLATDPENLAYLIYTSGSTGTPKGVEITHANLNHLIRWHCQTFSVTRNDRASHLAGLGFDAAGWEIWPYLAAGAAICLASDEVRSSPELIQQWILRERITVGFVPTVHAAAMMKMQWPATTSMRFMLTGGDALHHGPAVKLPFDVVNNYGPSETTVVATYCVLKSGMEGAPPIGHAITGATVYLLDENGQPIPENTVGEIYVGGNGVGRGYRNLSDSTARSFLPDPFSTVPGARMYRTGDRGIRRPDGEIEFHGRIDRQIKVRGQRVELDEISSLLINHPTIDFATVIASPAQNGDNQLVAYALAKENMALPAAQELQEYLADSLPDYMIPSLFVRLDAIPLSTNGKLDLKLLPKPAEKNLLRQRAARTDLTAVEKKLLATVRALIENSAIEIEDNYLLAGGHSLLGMQLLTRLRQAFGVDFSLRQIYESPTVERLAAAIESQLHQKQILAMWTDLLQRNQIGIDDNFFTVGGSSEIARTLQARIAKQFGRTISVHELLQNPTVRQHAELTRSSVTFKSALPHGVIPLQPNGTKRSFFWVQNLNVGLARAMGEDRPFLFVGYTEEDFAALDNAPSLQSIAACLLQKLMLVQPTGPYSLGGFSLGGTLAFEMASQLRSAGHQVSLLVLVDPPNPSYLGTRNPLTPKLKYPRYLLKRAKQLGTRRSLRYFGDYLKLRFAHILRPKTNKPELRAAHELIESAAASYHAEEYTGDALLIMATEHPPDVDFLPGWQEVLSGDLEVGHLKGHHRDLLVEPAVQTLANVILSRLDQVTGELISMRGTEDSSMYGT